MPLVHPLVLPMPRQSVDISHTRERCSLMATRTLFLLDELHHHVGHLGCPQKLPRWTFRIFFIFFLLGEGKGESEAPGRGGVRIFIENPRRGCLRAGRGGGGRGWKGDSGKLGGGGLNFFFRGRNSHQVAVLSLILKRGKHTIRSGKTDPVQFKSEKYASDPRPPHTRQKYEQTSGQNMASDASKQGKFGSLGAIFLFIFLPCMLGLGLQKESPLKGFLKQGPFCL